MKGKRLTGNGTESISLLTLKSLKYKNSPLFQQKIKKLKKIHIRINFFLTSAGEPAYPTSFKTMLKKHTNQLALKPIYMFTFTPWQIKTAIALYKLQIHSILSSSYTVSIAVQFHDIY